MHERVYQRGLIRELKRRFPGCVVLKNDPEYLQGIPDLSVFLGDRWGMLEAKVSENAPVQPNQEYYVDLMDDMSFASFIYPENEEAVLRELQQTLTEPRRYSRLPKRK